MKLVRPMGDLMRHVRLVLRMGKATDTDLAGAVERGDLSQAQWAGMVQRCRRCDWAESCEDWLEAHADGVDCAPGTCRNRARFAALRALQEAGEERD